MSPVVNVSASVPSAVPAMVTLAPSCATPALVIDQVAPELSVRAMSPAETVNPPFVSIKPVALTFQFSESMTTSSPASVPLSPPVSVTAIPDALKIDAAPINARLSMSSCVPSTVSTPKLPSSSMVTDPVEDATSNSEKSMAASVPRMTFGPTLTAFTIDVAETSIASVIMPVANMIIPSVTASPSALFRVRRDSVVETAAFDAFVITRPRCAAAVVSVFVI